MSGFKRWSNKLDNGNRLDISAGAGMEFSTKNSVNSSAGLRAQGRQFKPVFHRHCLHTGRQKLTLGVGACQDVQITALPQATLCAGAELRENRSGAAFSIGRNF